MLKSELKRCTQCGEVFEATAKDDQDIDDLDCPYLDCDGEGTIEIADLSDRFDHWRSDCMKTYIYVRGKVKVQVKNLYYKPLRKYNAAKRALIKWRQPDPRTQNFKERPSIDDLTDEQVRELQAELADGMPEHRDIGEEMQDDEPEVCPNCHNQDPDELAKNEGEYRCERCIMGGFN